MGCGIPLWGRCSGENSTEQIYRNDAQFGLQTSQLQQTSTEQSHLKGVEDILLENPVYLWTLSCCDGRYPDIAYPCEPQGMQASATN